MKRTLTTFILLLTAVAFCACSNGFTNVGNPTPTNLPENSEGFTNIGNPPDPLPDGGEQGLGKAFLFGTSEAEAENDVYFIDVNGDVATVVSTAYPVQTALDLAFGDDGYFTSEGAFTGLTLKETKDDIALVDAGGTVVSKLSAVNVTDAALAIKAADTVTTFEETGCFDVDNSSKISFLTDVRTKSFVQTSATERSNDHCEAPGSILAEATCNGFVYVECNCQNGRCTDEPTDILYPGDILKSTKNPFDLIPHGPTTPPAVINKFMISPPKISPEILQVIL